MVVLGASFDSVDKNRAFAEKYGYPYKLISDPEKTLAAYDVIDAKHPAWPRRISYLIGPDGRIVVAYAKVHTSTHAAQVLEDATRHASAAGT